MAGDSETNRAIGLFRFRLQPELCKTFAQPAPPDDPSEPGYSSSRAEWLNGLCYDWLLRGYKRTFSPFHRGVVTTYALEVGAAGDGDNRDHSFSAFRAARCPIHEILPIFAPITRNWNFCSVRAFRQNRRIPWKLLRSRRRAILLVGAARHDPKRVVRQRPLQRFRFIPRRPHPHVPLRQLGLGAVSHNVEKMSHARRPYPQVFPKYRNPVEPSETWAGRGKKPRWLTAQLESGKQIDDFRIDLAAA